MSSARSWKKVAFWMIRLINFIEQFITVMMQKVLLGHERFNEDNVIVNSTTIQVCTYNLDFSKVDDWHNSTILVLYRFQSLDSQISYSDLWFITFKYMKPYGCRRSIIRPAFIDSAILRSHRLQEKGDNSHIRFVHDETYTRLIGWNLQMNLSKKQIFQILKHRNTSKQWNCSLSLSFETIMIFF